MESASVSERFSVSFSSGLQSDALSEIPSEVIVRTRIKYGNVFEATTGIFMEYCRNSTVHGVRYLGQRKRPLIERLIWIGVFLISIYVCVHLISKVYKKWNDTPVIVSFNEGTAPIWDIPFPSVTLCPEIKTHARVFNITKAFRDIKYNISLSENYNETELNYLQALLHVCNEDNLKELDLRSLNLPSINIGEVLNELVPSINNSSPFCMFAKNIDFCENYFRPVQTDDGICYQFNGLDYNHLVRDDYRKDDLSGTSEWSLELGYDKPLESDVYPRRVITGGRTGGLIFSPMGFDYDIEYLCRGSVPGFRVYLHSPDEVPQAPKQYIRVPFSTEVMIFVTPNYITTATKLEKYHPERRQCYFNKERYLKFFKVYTQNNCQFECLINFTISECGCVKYTMPKPPEIPVCQVSDIECYTRAEYSVLEKEYETAIDYFKRGKSSVRTDCNCLPACTSLGYSFEISQAFFDIDKTLEAYNDPYIKEHPGLLMSRISIFFKEQHFTAIKRSELYGTSDFIANCGGLLALFIGLSAISLVELIYFCSVRLVSNIRMRRRKHSTPFQDVMFGEDALKQHEK